MKSFWKFDLTSIAYLILFWLFWFLIFTCRTVLAPLAPILEDEFKISHTLAGGLFASISIGNGIALFLMGIYSGAIGHKKSILISFIFNAFFLTLLSFNSFFFLLYPLLFGLGFTAGIYLPSSISLITKIYDERLWEKVIPIHDSAASASILLAPFIAYYLLKHTSWRGVFIILAVVFALASILFYLITKEVEEIKVEKKDTKRIFSEIVRNRTLWIISLILVVAAGGNMGLYYILPLYLSKELTLEISLAQKILGYTRIGAFVFSFTVGFLLEFFDIKRLLFFILFSSGILTFSCPFFSWDVMQYVLFLQATLISGMFPLCFVLSSRIFPLEKRAFAMGFVVSIASAFGIGIIPYILGFFGDHFTFALGIKLLGIIVTLASFFVLKL
ncbi:MAG: MFS transporter [Desulfobacterota bacterium]|nr:MFS transporter [Thermodesulfobacteriota bacterium]MDW8001631.1 MFS transporter [Deltaproteobacteria bacterium]